MNTHEKSAVVAPGTDRRFFTGMAVAVAVSVFAGFAPTYYLKGLYGTPALSPLFHFHGMLFTSWILLFLTQTTLIAVKRTDLHRRLGIVGGLLAVAMLVVGTAVAVASAKRGPQTPLPGFPPPLELLTTPLGALSSFAVLVAAGLYNRRKRATHKRLMLLAMIAAVGPGANRAAALLTGRPPGDFHVLLISALVLLGLIHDWRTRGRPHSVLFWGGALLIASQLTRRAIGGSDIWARVGHWLLS